MCNYSAEEIKAMLIDWLLSHYNNIIIGNEVMYGSKRKVVDLLAIINNITVAIEIKSSSDKLTRLPEQIEEYKRVFDRIIVVSTPSHSNGINKILSPDVGLYEVDRTIKRKQTPLLNHGQDKLEMLYSISSTFLKKTFPTLKGRNENELRVTLSRKKKTDIHKILIDFYQTRLEERFRLFLKDRGQQTLIDDIPLLSSLTLIDEF